MKFEDNEIGFVTGTIANLASLTVPVLEPANVLPKPSDDVPSTVLRK